MKNQEASDLRVQNRQLSEENTRLTDLTRMLLSSQAFSGFLSELSGTAPPSSTGNLQQSHSHSQPGPSQKDINPHQVARQLQNQRQQVGMATVSERTVDFPLIEDATSASSWNAGVGINNFSVYSITQVPEGPVLDVGKLSGKTDQEHVFQAPSFQAQQATKQKMPTFARARTLLQAEETVPFSSSIHNKPDSKLAGTALELYAEQSANQLISSVLSCAAHCTADAKKADSQSNPGLSNDDNEADVASGLALRCSDLDAVSARIAAVTSHLI